MRKNKFLRLTLASLLAISTVFAVPVTAEEDTAAIETDLLTSPITEPQPGSDNQPEFTAGFKEGVTQAVISLEDYLELHPEMISEISYGTSLEDYLLQTSGIQVLASTGTWEQQSNGDWKFVLSNGSYASGWHEINGAWYYFDSNNDNIMVTGWEKIGGYWYYFNPSGSMKHGWLSSTRDGETIYYYMGRPGEPDTGAMYTGGWLNDIDGSWYYLYTEADAAENPAREAGVMHTGWLYKSDGTSYFGSDGAAYCDTVVSIDGRIYGFNSSCYLTMSNTYPNIELSVMVMYDQAYEDAYSNPTSTILDMMENVEKPYRGKWNITFDVTTQKITDAPADGCPNDAWELCTFTAAGCGEQCVNSYTMPTFGIFKTNHHRNADLNAYYVEDHYAWANYDVRIYLTANAPCHEDGGQPHRPTALGFAPGNIKNERNFVWALNCPTNYGSYYSRGDLLNVRVVQHELTHLFQNTSEHCSTQSGDRCIMSRKNYNFDAKDEMCLDIWCDDCESNFIRTKLGS